MDILLLNNNHYLNGRTTTLGFLVEAILSFYISKKVILQKCTMIFNYHCFAHVEYVIITLLLFH